MDIRHDGKIVVSGYYGDDGLSLGDLFIAQYDTQGNLDVTFDGDGLIVKDLGSYDAVVGMVLAPDGKIILGASTSAIPYFYFLRYLP